MNIIPGYWDPFEMCFIEEPEVDILQLIVERSAAVSNGERDPVVSDAGAASEKKSC
jgi:hypothetical protein